MCIWGWQFESVLHKHFLEALSISHHLGARRRCRAEPFAPVGFYRRCPWSEHPGVAVLGFGK